MEGRLVKHRTLLIEETDGIIVVRLNRPDKLNAINGEMRKEIRDILGRIKTENDVRVVIITGSGRAFCAGADIDELGLTGSTDNSEVIKESLDLVKEIYEFEKPIIGAINGIAAGDGAQWALAFDLNLDAKEGIKAFLEKRKAHFKGE